jgi:alpha-galactosidase
MKVYIETNNGEQLEFEVGSGSTIFEFKQMIIEDHDMLDSNDKIKFNDKLIQKEDLTLEEAGIQNKSILRIQRKNKLGLIPGFFAKMTFPLMATGLLFGAGHYVGVKFLHLFKHLVKHADLGEEVVKGGAKAVETIATAA